MLGLLSRLSYGPADRVRCRACQTELHAHCLGCAAGVGPLLGRPLLAGQYMSYSPWLNSGLP
ncbi:hypothetical protein Droror1_Dr00025426, partial [Drosera rotundifolia]